MATFYQYGLSDEKPNHGVYPKDKNSWCSYQRAEARGEFAAYTQDYSPLPPDVLKAIKPIHEDLGNDNLLSRYSKADDRARQTGVETMTRQSADRADEMQSAEGHGEELNTSKNDSTTMSSSPEGGDITAHGYDSPRTRTLTPRSRPRSGRRRRTTARDRHLRHRK
ncbi:hypothetical protein EVAR_18284_1 [Eumeta japonica]|uniref:Uncharacterized protein n=1 Tax=Eumeta variegata TaxID=151549 RepID=A0A4C1UL08_EUMVA|nr:hypothetical protein EVAR_18284_1 [Eumeta japonica]